MTLHCHSAPVTFKWIHVIFKFLTCLFTICFTHFFPGNKPNTVYTQSWVRVQNIYPTMLDSASFRVIHWKAHHMEAQRTNVPDAATRIQSSISNLRVSTPAPSLLVNTLMFLYSETSLQIHIWSLNTIETVTESNRQQTPFFSPSLCHHVVESRFPALTDSLKP